MKELDLTVFAKRVKELRIYNRLSTRALGKEIDISNATISRYENGKRDPGLVFTYKIAKYFNVSVEYLCGENINSDINKLQKIFNNLSEDSKRSVFDYIKYLYNQEQSQ